MPFDHLSVCDDKHLGRWVPRKICGSVVHVRAASATIMGSHPLFTLENTSANETAASVDQVFQEAASSTGHSLSHVRG